MIRRLPLLFMAFCACAPAAPRAAPEGELPALVVRRGPLEDRLLLTGEVEAARAEPLTTPLTPSWVVTLRWLIEDGAHVKKGDRVAAFDTTAMAATLEDKRAVSQRAQRELAGAVAQAAVTMAEKQMEVQRQRALLDKARVQAAVPADLYPLREYQEKQLQVQQAQDALAKAEDALRAEQRAQERERAIKDVAQQRAARELSELEQRLEQLTLRAPRDGVVQIAVNRREDRKYLVGDASFAGAQVASLPDLSVLQVRARLMDVDDGAIKAGMATESIPDAYPSRRIPGRVQQITALARQEGRDTARRFFDVVLTLEQVEPGLLQPGMSMRVEVIRRRLGDATLIPRAALPATSGLVALRCAAGQGCGAPLSIDVCSEIECAVQGGPPPGTALLPAVQR